jgi:hypothetical protein
MDEQMNMQAAPASEPKKWVWLAAAALAVLALLGWWMWRGAREAVAPQAGEPVLSESDTTAAIDQELQSTDLGNLEAELQAAEADLQSL